MIPESQRQQFDFLNRLIEENQGERIDTHISAVFLCQDKAYKLKRAVKLPFLDFSSLEQRKAACDNELRINRKISPELYLGIEPLVRTKDYLQIGGEGEIIDWLVVMQRFDKATTLDRLSLTPELCQKLAVQIANFHSNAGIISGVRGYFSIKNTIDNNYKAFMALKSNILDIPDIDELTELQKSQLLQIQDILDYRAANGYVRSCHGDLHLGNICIYQNKPTLFDAIEFDPALSNIDVLYDLAFILMDLDCRGFPELGNLLLNHYLSWREDWEHLHILPLFLSLRAAIRSHVAGARLAALDDFKQREKAGLEARNYLTKAKAYLKPNSPYLLGVGGFSGSGKSKLARGLAPSLGLYPGAIILRSDILRKQLSGVSPLDKLPEAGYSPEMNVRTYARLYELAEKLLEQDLSVVVDAVFAREEERTNIEKIAQKRKLPFQGFWLQAKPEIMAARINSRKDNPSDATVEILTQQLEYETGNISWKLIDSSGLKEETLQQARLHMVLE